LSCRNLYSNHCHGIPKPVTLIRSHVQDVGLRQGQISLALKHYAAMYDMLRQGYGRALVLEDDAGFRSDARYTQLFSCCDVGDGGCDRTPQLYVVFDGTSTLITRRAGKLLTFLLKEVPPDFDVVFVGGCHTEW
jgi:hypothetical protein